MLQKILDTTKKARAIVNSGVDSLLYGSSKHYVNNEIKHVASDLSNDAIWGDIALGRTATILVKDPVSFVSLPRPTKKISGAYAGWLDCRLQAIIDECQGNGYDLMSSVHMGKGFLGRDAVISVYAIK